MSLYRNRITGEMCCSDGDGYGDADVWEMLAEDGVVPNDGRVYRWIDGALVPDPLRLTYDQVAALYTPAEIRRIFYAPQVQITQMLLALQRFGVVLGSIEHVQGTALVDGLGLLDGPDRAARILAGLPPAIT